VDHRPNFIDKWSEIGVVEIDHHDYGIAGATGIFHKGTIAKAFTFTVFNR